MRKYRIKMEVNYDGKKKYYLQKRVLIVAWVNALVFTSSGLKYSTTDIEKAREKLGHLRQNQSKTRYIYE